MLQISFIIVHLKKIRISEKQIVVFYLLNVLYTFNVVLFKAVWLLREGEYMFLKVNVQNNKKQKR
jgi:hypothetical protein